MLDLQSRRVVQLLRHLQRMPLTDVVFSRDHQVFCVIMNRCVASFLTTAPHARLLFSVTFSSPITVAFANSSDQAVIATEKGRLSSIIRLSARDGPVRLVRWTKVANLPKGAITGIAVRRAKLFVGSAGGLMGRVEMATGRVAVTEARQMKHAVARIVASGRASVLAVGERGHCSFLTEDDEWLPLPCPAKNAVMCAPLAFLCRAPGAKCLSVVQLASAFRPLVPPLAARLPVLRPPAEIRRLLREQPPTPAACLAHGLPFLYRLLRVDGITGAFQQYMGIMRRLIAQSAALRSRAVRMLYLLRDLDAAREMLMSTPAGDPLFVANTIKGVLMGSMATPGIEMGTAQFLGVGFVDEAIDLLLMTGGWSEAASMLIGMGNLAEATLVCRVQEQSEIRTQLVTSLAKRMLMSGMQAYGLLLLAELGGLDEIVQYFVGELEVEQADFLKKVTLGKL